MRLPCTNVRVSVCEIVIALPILETTAKSVQTTAEVCADYTCSLYRLQLKSPESTTHLLKCLRVLIEVGTSYSFLAVVVEEPQRGDTPA